MLPSLSLVCNSLVSFESRITIWSLQPSHPTVSGLHSRTLWGGDQGLFLHLHIRSESGEHCVLKGGLVSRKGKELSKQVFLLNISKLPNNSPCLLPFSYIPLPPSLPPPSFQTVLSLCPDDWLCSILWRRKMLFSLGWRMACHCFVGASSIWHGNATKLMGQLSQELFIGPWGRGS